MISLGKTKNCIPVGCPFKDPGVVVSGRCGLCQPHADLQCRAVWAGVCGADRPPLTLREAGFCSWSCWGRSWAVCRWWARNIKGSHTGTAEGKVVT